MAFVPNKSAVRTGRDGNSRLQSREKIQFDKHRVIRGLKDNGMVLGVEVFLVKIVAQQTSWNFHLHPIRWLRLFANLIFSQEITDRHVGFSPNPQCKNFDHQVWRVKMQNPFGCSYPCVFHSNLNGGVFQVFVLLAMKVCGVNRPSPDSICHIFCLCIHVGLILWGWNPNMTTKESFKRLIASKGNKNFSREIGEAQL